jgi:hypothetical protein
MTKLKISISKGNRKMGKDMPSVSLPPILACAKWVTKCCAKLCYAMKAFRQYKDTKKAWTRNLKLATEHRMHYFIQVHNFLRDKKPRFFRWHVSGDMLDQSYVDWVINLAKVFPEIKFLAFTKRYEFDYHMKPDNLTIVFSAWPGRHFKNPNNYPVAWMQDGTETRIPKDAIECHSGCDTCGMCWNLATLKRDVYFHKH